jgi:hypothetical protein
MATVEQMIHTVARRHPQTPYWVLEKDYALSYLLAALAGDSSAQQALALKGGTALRKFYFAGYRFSEDLDFTAPQPLPSAALDAMIDKAVRAMEHLLQQRGPFLASLERLVLREPHPGGQLAYVVRVRFPTHPEPLCRLKVEISQDEVLLLPVERRHLQHEFPEALTAELACYSIEEIVAEKLRALLQSRSRLSERGWGASRVCRDYYDLWSILKRSQLRLALFPDLVAKKCSHRGVAFADVSDFFAQELITVARQEWDRQLRPFVFDCPTVDEVLAELPGLVESIWAGEAPAIKLSQ